MNISSAGSAYSLLQNQAAQHVPETAEIRMAGRGNDGDSDDKGVKAAQVPSSPTVNLSGQKVGQVINVAA